MPIRVVCPMVFLGCKWQGSFGSLAQARDAEAIHWSQKHDETLTPKEEDDGQDS